MIPNPVSGMISQYALPVVGVAAIGLAVFGGIQTLRIGNLKSDLAIEKLAHKTDIATWKAASEKARADALAIKAATEARQAQNSNEVGNDIQTGLDALRRALAAGVRPASANNPRGARPGYLPSTAEAAASLNVAADTSTCSGKEQGYWGEAYIIGTGWQDWYRRMAATRGISEIDTNPGND